MLYDDLKPYDYAKYDEKVYNISRIVTTHCDFCGEPISKELRDQRIPLCRCCLDIAMRERPL